MIIHEDYSVSRFDNDIALLELSADLDFSSSIQPIELETEDVGVVDTVVSGWGLLASGSVVPDIMQFIDLRTLTAQQCQNFWGAFFNADLEICTLTQSGEGVCTGDSGGPLVADGKQIGVVAWAGFPCAGGRPDVYAKVSAFIDWIDNNINQ